MTTTPTVTAEDCGDPAVRSFVLVSGPAWGIQLPNGTLYREPHAQIQDPHSTQPTVWFRQGAAQDQATAIAVMLDAWYGIEPSAPNELRVVALEMDTDGFWKLPPPVADQIGYRPLDLDTELVSAWPCASLAQLTVAEARQVMREHKECAGPIPCTVRGRARALLSREGVLRLNRSPEAWQGLCLPDQAR